MALCRLLLIPFVCCALHPTTLFSQDEAKPKKKIEKKTPAAEKKSSGKSVEELTEYAKPSIVVILYTGREGKQQGLGTGFVISEDGLIATNLHVIGDGSAHHGADAGRQEARRHGRAASDRSLDLAIIKIDAKGLKPLPLGDSDTAAAMASRSSPSGIRRGSSTASWPASSPANAKSKACNMLQIAMPIEPGNSGGPVLDMAGNVVGVVTMKSLVTPNLGFAVPTSSLQKLIAKPNPIPMENWVTLGTLDPSEWLPTYGGAGGSERAASPADGTGTGFGGRTVCFHPRKTPPRCRTKSASPSSSTTKREPRG